MIVVMRVGSLTLPCHECTICFTHKCALYIVWWNFKSFDLGRGEHDSCSYKLGEFIKFKQLFPISFLIAIGIVYLKLGYSLQNFSNAFGMYLTIFSVHID